MYTAQNAFSQHNDSFVRWNNQEQSRKEDVNQIAQRMFRTSCIVYNTTVFWIMKQHDLARICRVVQENDVSWYGKNYIYRNEDFIGWYNGENRFKEKDIEKCLRS